MMMMSGKDLPETENGKIKIIRFLKNLSGFAIPDHLRSEPHRSLCNNVWWDSSIAVTKPYVIAWGGFLSAVYIPMWKFAR